MLLVLSDHFFLECWPHDLEFCRAKENCPSFWPPGLTCCKHIKEADKDEAMLPLLAAVIYSIHSLNGHTPHWMAQINGHLDVSLTEQLAHRINQLASHWEITLICVCVCLLWSSGGLQEYLLWKNSRTFARKVSLCWISEVKQDNTWDLAQGVYSQKMFSKF